MSAVQLLVRNPICPHCFKSMSPTALINHLRDDGDAPESKRCPKLQKR